MNNSCKIVQDLILSATQSAGYKTDLIPQFRRIGLPRRWGLTSTYCIELAAFLLRTELDELQQSLDKKQFKQVKSTKVGTFAKEIAEKIAVGINNLPSEFSEVQAENGYLNFYFSNNQKSLSTIREILFNPNNYGKLPQVYSPHHNYISNSDLPAKVMVEYSQPNTHKLFHVGHLRNVVLGNSICNLLETAGYRVIRANYIGDIGTHVAKWMAMNEEINTEADIARIYERAANKYKESPEFQLQVKNLLAEWSEDFYNYASGAEATTLFNIWIKSKQLSLDLFNRIYSLLGVSFDIDYFESDVEIASKRFVIELFNKLSIHSTSVIHKESEGEYQGCITADLSHTNLGKVVLLRSDDTTMYLTKDLALAKHKFDRHKLDVSIYITAREQELHFKQLFTVLDLAGFTQSGQCIHLPYDLVILPSGKMSSREGNIVSFDEFYAAVREEIARITAEKGVSVDQTTTIDAITDGVLKFPMLAVDMNNTITFDWDQALSFDGFAAPYIQYAYARTRSLVADFIPDPDSLSIPEELSQSELVLIEKLLILPELITECAGDVLAVPPIKPKVAPLARYAYDLAVAFNDFYHACPVLKSDVDKITKFWRQHLVYSFRIVLKRVFTDILGIKLPEVM